MRQIAVAHHGTDSQSAIRRLLYLRQRQRIDINQAPGCLHIELHQINERSAARNKLGFRRGSDAQHRLNILSTGVIESSHSE